MDCVYNATVAHLEALGVMPRECSKVRFRALRFLYNHSWVKPTPGSIAPWLVKQLAGKELGVRVQTSNYMTGAHWVRAANGRLARRVARNTRWEYADRIALAPAIYLLWGTRHAVFGTEVPGHGLPVVAIQIYKEVTNG